MDFDISESDRQLIVLAMALMGLLRSGFSYAALEVAKKFGGEKMFADFTLYNAETVQPQASRLDFVMKLDWIKPDEGVAFQANVPFCSGGERGIYEVRIVRRPAYCDRGDWMIHVDVDGYAAPLSSFDGCDGFPRFFFGDEREAKAQMELWANRRQDIRNAIQPV